jgi:hypothetical protein
VWLGGRTIHFAVWTDYPSKLRNVDTATHLIKLEFLSPSVAFLKLSILTRIYNTYGSIILLIYMNLNILRID